MKLEAQFSLRAFLYLGDESEPGMPKSEGGQPISILPEQDLPTRRRPMVQKAMAELKRHAKIA
jgi:hypothetical protein